LNSQPSSTRPSGRSASRRDRPEDREQDEGAEPLALGEGARDEGRRDRREHQLEGGEQDERDGGRVVRARRESDVVEEREVETADQAPAVDVGTEREREADDDPDDADEGETEPAVHDRREDVLAAHEPAIEERETRQHDHDQRGGCQHPGGITTVHSIPFLRDAGVPAHARTWCEG